MKNLFIEIITSSDQKLIKKIREISDKKYNQIINSDDDQFSKEVIQNDFVISFYKDHKIDLPNNLIFDISFDDNDIYLIDEINTRDLLN